MKKNLIKELKNSIPPLTKVDINDKGYVVKYFVHNGVISIGDLKQFGEELKSKYTIIKNIVVYGLNGVNTTMELYL